MIIRLRSKDGLERIQLPDGAHLGELHEAIHQQLGVPLEDMALSRDPGLLKAGRQHNVSLLAGSHASLESLGVSHGDIIYLLYHFERTVEPAVKLSEFERRPFGSCVTVGDIVSKQARIERQDKPTVEGVSFDRAAANAFQAYCQSALAFSIKRGGILYGTVDESGLVRVDFVYEPPQQGSADQLLMERHTAEETQVDLLAESLGFKKVGWIFCQAVPAEPRDYIMSSNEVVGMAAMQDELGEQAVTVLVTFDPDDQGGHVHFEVFQCSKQAVQLWKDGWFPPEERPAGVSKLRNPKHPDLEWPIMVAGKDTDSVDNDWFLCPMRILDHEGPLLTMFPVENRLLSPQTKSDLKVQLQQLSGRPYEQRLADLHLLLWLSKQPNLDLPDMLAICSAVKQEVPLMEGYRVIVDSIAGV